jgi:hypothetical protein
MSDQSRSNVEKIRPLEAKYMIDHVRALRERIISGWQERGVMLSREEQDQLPSGI